MRRATSLASFLALLTVSTATQAAVPQLINYQGLLTDNIGDPVVNASYSVVFTIYDAAVAGTSVWTETQNVNTVNGLFAVLLGSVTPILDTVFDASPRFLGIKIGDDAEVSPRTALVTVPWAYRANNVENGMGIAATTDSSKVLVQSSDFFFEDVLTLSITLPEPGFVSLKGRANFKAKGTTGGNFV